MVLNIWSRENDFYFFPIQQLLQLALSEVKQPENTNVKCKSNKTKQELFSFIDILLCTYSLSLYMYVYIVNEKAKHVLK